MDYNPSGDAGPSRPSYPFGTQAPGQSSSSSSRPGPSNPSASSQQQRSPFPTPPQSIDSTVPFDIFEWYPQHISCVSYFLNVAQHSEGVQALCAFINISLPFQKSPPILSFATSSSSPGSSHPGSHRGSVAGLTPPNPFPHAPSSHTGLPHQAHHSGASPSSYLPTPSTRGGLGGAAGSGSPSASNSSFISLIPYIRRLIATGSDTMPVLHGFFGDSWLAGIGPMHEMERRNYLFAAKASNWLKVKSAYDGHDENEMVPFLKPLRSAEEKEIRRAEEKWSDWLAMQDWMVGERGIDVQGQGQSRTMTGFGAEFGFGSASRTQIGDAMDEDEGSRIKSEPR